MLVSKSLDLTKEQLGHSEQMDEENLAWAKPNKQRQSVFLPRYENFVIYELPLWNLFIHSKQ